MRLAFTVLLVCLLGLSTGEPPLAQRANLNPAEKLQSKWQDLLDDYADRHVKLGTRYQTAGDVSRAIRQYRSALWLVTDHRAARLSLGYKLREGKWEEDALLVEPEPVDESKLSPEELRALERKRELVDRRCVPILSEETRQATALAKSSLEIASKAGLLKLTALRKSALQIAGAYAPYNADVAKARDFISRDGEWEHPKLALPAQLAGRLLTSASSGRPLGEPDAQATALGWKSMQVRTDDTLPFTVRTTKGSERSMRLMKVADSTAAVVRELLGQNGNTSFKEGNFVVTEVSSREEFTMWLDKFDNGDAVQRIINRRATAIWTGDPFGCMIHWLSDLAADDAASNSIAMAIQWNVRGRQSAPWVRDGFCYLVTTRLLGTTMIKRYEVESRSRTHDWNYELNRTPRGNPYGPSEFRRLALEMVRLGGDISFSDLAKTVTSKMTERHIAKSLSLMEFLVTAHPDKFKAWMTQEIPRNSDGDLPRLLSLLELDEAGLQAAWADWIASHY